MTITIEYLIFDDGTELGSECYDNYQEVLFPDFDNRKHDVYVRKFFLNRNETLWKINHLYINMTTVSIFVSPQRSSTSLGEAARLQNKTAKFFLDADKYQIIEVEFGIQQDIMTPVGRNGKNTKYSSALLPGDLYKKRPCILIGYSGDRVKVIPLTSSGNRKNAKQMEINPAAFAKLSSRYSKNGDNSDKESYALVDIIQTVSTYRVFPVRLSNGTFSDDYNSYHLVKSDIDELKGMLVTMYADEVEKENIILKQRIEKSNKERKSMLEKRNNLKNELTSKVEYIAKLEGSLVDLASFEDVNYSSLYELMDVISELVST